MMDEIQAIKDRLEDQKKSLIECFTPCFKVKVVDSLIYYNRHHQSPEIQKSIHKRQTVITFIRTNEEIYRSLEEGQRYRLFNLKPDNIGHKNSAPNNDTLFLQFQPKGKSKRENIVDMAREFLNPLPLEVKNELLKIKEFSKTQISQPLRPLQLIDKLKQLSRVQDSPKLDVYK